MEKMNRGGNDHYGFEIDLISGWGTILLGGIGLLKWLMVMLFFANVPSNSYAMAPDSSVLFVLFGSRMLGKIYRQKKSKKIISLVIPSILTLWGLFKVMQYMHGFITITQKLSLYNGMPDKSSFHTTGFLFFIIGIALLSGQLGNEKFKTQHIVGGLGLIVSMIGFSITLGYIYKTPVIYSNTIVSLSVINAIAFFLAGIGLIVNAGTQNIFTRYFYGPSASARLLRVIIPLIILIILIQGYMDVRFFNNSSFNHTILYVLSILLLIILTIFVIVKVSQIVFKSADKAETERRKAETLLKHSEENLRLILNTAAEAIYGIDLNGKCTFCNATCLHMLGYSHPSDLIGHDIHSLIHYQFPDKTNYPLDDCHIFEALKKREGIHMDSEVLWRADKTSFYAEYWSYPQYIDNEIVGAVVTFLDISERKHMEEELKKSHKDLENKVKERTQALQENYNILNNIYKLVPGVICQFQLFQNGHSCFPYVSNAIIDIFEMTPEEIKDDSSKLFARLHPDDYEFIMTSIKESAQKLDSLHVEFRMILPNKGLRWGMSDARPQQQEDGSILWHGFITDITDRITMQESLRKSEERFRDMVENTIDWIWEIDQNGNFTYTSPQVSSILGYQPEELKNKTLFDLLSPDDKEKMQRIITEKMQKKERIFSMECIHLRKDGEQVVLERNSVPVYNPDCTVAGYRGIDRDITKRIKAQKELKSSEYKYRMLHETLRDGFVSTDLSGTINEVNKPFLEMLGYEKNEIISLNCKEITPRQWYQADIETFRNQILKYGYSGIYEKEFRKKDGSLLPVGLRTILIRDENGKPSGMWSIVRDISERKRLQKLIIDATLETEEKERNRFSEDIHDGLGPLLSTINLYVNAILSPDYNKEQKQEMKRNLPHITQQAIQTAREVARNLMPSVLKAYGLVKAIEAFCNDIKKSSEVSIDFNSENYINSIPKNKEMLTYRIIIELINNTIKHSKATLITIKIESNRDMFWLYYTDNGIGFHLEEVMKDPESKGQGLHNIFNRVKTLEGQMNYTSEPGNGVKVSLNYTLNG